MPASSAAGTAAAVRTAQATVSGKTETILVNAQGLPLYYYQPDTATKSLVAGQLAVAWPPLTSAKPTATGLSGKLTAVSDAHGSQVAYNGHLLYTFVTDQPGQVTGQGVQNFFVATPGMPPITGASATTRPVRPPRPRWLRLLRDPPAQIPSGTRAGGPYARPGVGIVCRCLSSGGSSCCWLAQAATGAGLAGCTSASTRRAAGSSADADAGRERGPRPGLRAARQASHPAGSWARKSRTGRGTGPR